MILTGKLLKERALEKWGSRWQDMLGRRGGISRICAWRWGQKKTGHTRAVKYKLLHALEEDMRITAVWIDELREDLGC